MHFVHNFLYYVAKLEIIMEFMQAVVRFVVGGFLITFVSFLGDTKYSLFSGLAVLFPIVTLTGYYFLSKEVSQPELQEIVLFSILGVPTVWGFVVGFYLAMQYFSISTSLLLGIVSWFIVASIVVGIDMKITQLVM